MKIKMKIKMKAFSHHFLIFFSTLFGTTSLYAQSSFENFNAGKLGKVTIYGHSQKSPQQLLLLLSPGEGKKNGEKDLEEKIAQELVAQGKVMVRIDAHAYLKKLDASAEKCHYPAADLESLSHLVQKKYGFTNYLIPSLAGIAEGATLAYGVLAQSPDNTFTGAATLKFSPELSLKRSLCAGKAFKSLPLKLKKGFELLTTQKLTHPWFNTTKPVDFEQAIAKLKQPEHEGKATAQSLDLPLIEVPVPSQKNQDLLIIIVSGDGGWASLDKELAQAFQAEGHPVVGLDSLKYFWNEKKPERIGEDFARLAQYYLKQWKKKKVLWIGYSMGADILPFAISRLPLALQEQSLAAVYLGLAERAEFEFHVSNWLTSDSSEQGRPIRPEIEKIAAQFNANSGSSFKQICIRGQEEKDSGCDALKKPIDTVVFPGGHHFGGEYQKIAQLILKKIGF